jgi:hypothetical protein
MKRLHQAAPALLSAAQKFLEWADDASPADMARLKLLFGQAVGKAAPMTVADLIRELYRMPQDAHVTIWVDGDRLPVDSVEWFDPEGFVEITAGVDE